MGWVRDIVDTFSPSMRAIRQRENSIRVKSLERAEVLMAKRWEAADNGRIRGESWLTSQLSVNSDLEIDLETLWDRSEDLMQNDNYASAAIYGRCDNVIGSGMTFHSRIRPFGDLISDKDADSINARREQLFRVWAKKDKFRKKQRQFELSKATYGEGLAVMSDITRDDGRPIPLTWQVINPRRLETPPRMEGNPRVRLGIQFADAAYTVIEGYWIRDAERRDHRQLSEDYTFFPAARVTHSFEGLVPGQIRGVPWLTPVMARLKDIKDFSEAKLIAEQVSACTTTFIKCDDPQGRAVGAATGTDSQGRRLQELEPGRIEYIGQDDDVSHVDPNRPGGTFAPYVEHNLMGVAAGLRFSYALLAKDFRKASFANGRLEMADARKSFEAWQFADIEDAFTPVVERATEEMVILGLIPGLDAATYRAFPEAYNSHQMKPPRWRMSVNPKQENDADVVEVDNMFASRTDKCDEREGDFEDVLAAQEREETLIMEMKARLMAKRQELGLTPDEPNSDAAGDKETDVEDLQRELEMAT